MVWFQCEDCGDNLKKPKLSNHFNFCSATKLSCIDCGETFGQESVQGHTQCITEMEKYGPKSQGKPLNVANANQNKDAKQKPDFDINVGLSDRPPWFCSLCNTKATSKQTLLLHAEGKKHKGKARAVHATKQEQNQTENTPNGQVLDKKDVEHCNVQDAPIVESECMGLEASNGNVLSEKKRKLDESADDITSKKKKDGNNFAGLGNGEVIQVSGKERMVSKSVPASDESMEKIKWKKLITSALKSSPEGALKMRKLRKTVLKALHESGVKGDADKLGSTLESKINSSSRFAVENKYVRLVAKD